MKINSSYSSSLYSQSKPVNSIKLVKSMSDFNQVIENRNRRIFKDVINNTLKEHNKGDFTPTLIKGHNLDVYA